MHFEGDANYDEGGLLRFKKLIVSEHRIAFEVESVTAEYGNWHAAGIAQKIGDTFQSSQLFALQNGVRSAPFTLRLRAQISPDMDACKVDGAWTENGVEYLFKGELDVAYAA